MRIMFLTNMYPPLDVGGYEQWCFEVANGLKARGHQLFILTSRFDTDKSQLPPDPDVSRTLHLLTDLDYYRPAEFFIRRRERERLNRQALEKAIERFKPDVILVWGMWQLSLNLPQWAEELCPGKVAYYIASYWPDDLDPHHAYWQLPANHKVSEMIKRPLRQRALAKLNEEKYPPQLAFNHVACCSHYVRDMLISKKKLPEHATVLYGGIDTTLFEGLPNHEELIEPELLAEQGQGERRPLKLLYFGRLIADKGVHIAIEALHQLNQAGLGDRVHLTIIGSGHPDYTNELHRLVSRYQLDHLVTFAGRVPAQEIPIHLQDYDVFLFTSIWPEPFGRTILEAMMAGLCVIGADVGGSSEILADYDPALRFPPKDAAALADRLRLVIEDPQRIPGLVRLGRDIVQKNFAMPQMIDRLELYLRAVADCRDGVDDPAA